MSSRDYSFLNELHDCELYGVIFGEQEVQIYTRYGRDERIMTISGCRGFMANSLLLGNIIDDVQVNDREQFLSMHKDCPMVKDYAKIYRSISHAERGFLPLSAPTASK